MHIWCNPAFFIALPVSIQLQETTDPLLCLNEKSGVLLWFPVGNCLVDLVEFFPYLDNII